MTATQTQLRRGTQAQNDVFAGAVGEFTIDTTNDRARIHDATKDGGFHVPNHTDIQGNKMIYAAASGVDTIVASYYPEPDVPGDGTSFLFKAVGPNTGPATFKANYSGATDDDILKDDGQGTLIALDGGEFATGGIYELRRSGSDWHLQAAGSAASGGLQLIETFRPDGSVGTKTFSGWAAGTYERFLLKIDEVGGGSASDLRLRLAVDDSLYTSNVYGDLPGNVLSYFLLLAAAYYDGGNYRGASGDLQITNGVGRSSFYPKVYGDIFGPLFQINQGKNQDDIFGVMATGVANNEVTGIQLYMSSGNFSNIGVVSLYGIRS